MTNPSPIRIEAGRVLCDVPGLGPCVLQPSHKNWKRRRAWWRVRTADGRAITGWKFTPLMALRAAAHLSIASSTGAAE